MSNTNQYIKLLSVNVGRSSTAHTISLETAFRTNIDMLLLQEPYTSRDPTRRITCTHPSFECFTPVDDWSLRPRVLIYTKKNSGLTIIQTRPEISPDQRSGDIIFLKVKTANNHWITIINIYNAPPGSINAGAALEFLFSLSNTFNFKNCIFAGDFNLHHNNWQPSYSGTPSPQAILLTQWLEAQNFSLISEVDIPTHNRGNVLDLCFASHSLLAKGSIASTQPDLDITSDHLPLLITIPTDFQKTKVEPKLRFATIDESIFQSLLKSNIAALTPLRQKSCSSIDIRAEELVTALQNSFAGSAKRSLPRNTGKPWWDQSCREARQRYRDILRTGNVSHTEKKEYRRAIKRAKRSFYKKKVDEASKAKDIFDIVKWQRAKGVFRTPPLHNPLAPNDPPAQTLEDKREVLYRNLLCNQTETEDIPLDTPSVPKKLLPFPNLTLPETSRAILEAGNTTPGKDGIPSALLRLGWPYISNLVLDLFQACIDTGHHPRCFRTAILTIIGKPNKADMTSPSSYRPIALLSVFGKGLERLVARRMAWISIKFKILAHQQFGALPLRSSVDLTTCLTHDIENSLNKCQTASVATLDIKGAFDAILPGRLVYRLREQGWLSHLCKWIGSFATKRTVLIRLDGETGPPQAITCGLPQGSPISPILFMLYISPLFHLKDLKKAFGYADDVAILETSPSLELNSIRIKEAINAALAWGKDEGVTFDPKKSELMHFSRRHKDKGNSPKVQTSNFTISENTNPPYLKWLGVHFDKKLTFKSHALIQAAKALNVANALRHLGNTTRGAPPRLLRQAVLSCVLPIAHFAAETWWPGKTRNKNSKIVSNRVGNHLNALSKVYTTAARAILPVYRTTPTQALLREAGLNPAEIYLENIVRRSAVRTRRLDDRHPLRRRSTKLSTNQTLSRFAQSLESIPPSEFINPLAHPPWEIEELPNYSIFPSSTEMPTPESEASIFYNFLNTLPKNDILIYSDGSKLPNGNAGAGFVIFQLGRQICTGASPLGKLCEANDAEAHAALLGIKSAIALPSTRFSKDLWVFVDNYSVSRKLLSKTSVWSSQAIYLEALETTKLWQARARLPHISEGEIKICWIPSHAGIHGNELADFEAKRGAAMPYNESQQQHSLASLCRWQKEKTDNSRDIWWQAQAPKMYSQLEIHSAPLPPKELLLSRKFLGHLFASRTGHGDFAEYHTRFNHHDANLNCKCGSPKAPLHFFFCRILRRRRGRPPGPISFLIPTLLGTPKGAITLSEWLDKTDFFVNICPR